MVLLVAAGTCCNGHINNRHWSVYCDNGVHAHPLASSPEPCTANGNMPQQRQTPYQGTGTAYYMFHTTAYAPLSSHDADGNYLFYFRWVRRAYGVMREMCGVCGTEMCSAVTCV